MAARGAWGSIFRVDLNSDREGGLISIFVLGDARHSSFDNLTFADANTLLATEDRGDTLHSQLNRLDSIWSFFVDGSPATRFVALGRDKLAEIDASLLGLRAIRTRAITSPPACMCPLGARWLRVSPEHANLDHPRAFFTQQHGMNTVYEVVKKK